MTKNKTEHEEPAVWELTNLPAAPEGFNPADDDRPEIIRKNYREPIVDDDAVHAEINGRSHRVRDIGSHGLGLVVPSFGGFLAGSLHDVTLHLGPKTIYLQATVTHVSPIETPGECYCGIEFADLSPKDAQTLQQFLTTHHAKLFTKTSLPADPGQN
jgi:hypothetical protein